ncbi:aliphatic sulfonate ABC transporter substrate-binding protein [Stella sp.]|uniref:aliphatic sulfonate ABC transporter substrate-binding protein n=1 Tax=Stella sp. TaxID=2912054 RepID=UPI0035B41A0C
MTSRRAFLGAAAGALVLAGSGLRPAAARGQPRELRIGYQKEGILAVVRQRGTLEARLAKLGGGKVRWVAFPFGPPMLEALGAGSIDLGSVGDTPPVFAQSAGAPIVYVASTPATQNAILVRPDSPVRSVTELAGKTIAIARGSSSHNFTIQALGRAGLAFGAITPAYLGPAEALAAFTRGEVDAWTVWDPYVAMAELDHGARPIAATETDRPGNSFYLANRQFADRHGRLLAAILDELRRTYRWADRHRGRVATLISQITGVDPAAQERTIRRLRIELRPMDDAATAEQQKIADAFHALALIPRPIRVAEAVWRGWATQRRP